MMEEKNISYLSANTLPLKMILNQGLLSEVRDKHRIIPFHTQLIPTNKCNLSCEFCSCGKRDKKEQLTLIEIKSIIDCVRGLGCSAITITGGGEPLIHPDINGVIDHILHSGMEVGLTTNGTLLDKLGDAELGKLTWCRVSASDRTIKNLKGVGKELDDWFSTIDSAVKRAPGVDWSLSYVLTAEPDFELLRKIIEFGNKHKFTHIRLTPDLLDLANVAPMDDVKKKLREIDLDDSLVVYQERKNYQRGDKKCYISMLKPLIAADGWVYPCCGTQYAKKKPARDNDKNMRICRADDISGFYSKQVPFDGSGCDVCYYSQYNYLISLLLSDITHKKFI